VKKFIKQLPVVRSWIRKIDNQNERTDWVRQQLKRLPDGAALLDAGCGSQRFRIFCGHLEYKGQDFGQYVSDEKKMLGGNYDGLGEGTGYKYGHLDYVGDIWDIGEVDASFDAILCTEVIEHVPFPIQTLQEFSRLLRPGGTLIMTAPNACLRHMDPYFFYSGFSDRWFEKFLEEFGFEIEEISPVGDYYSWMGVELARTGLAHSFFSKLILLPAFLYFFNKQKTKESVDTLCMGYHIRATKLAPGSH
jgi:SAM-dependent methyltransferase